MNQNCICFYSLELLSIFCGWACSRQQQIHMEINTVTITRGIAREESIFDKPDTLPLLTLHDVIDDARRKNVVKGKKKTKERETPQVVKQLKFLIWHHTARKNKERNRGEKLLNVCKVMHKHNRNEKAMAMSHRSEIMHRSASKTKGMSFSFSC